MLLPRDSLLLLLLLHTSWSERFNIDNGETEENGSRDRVLARSLAALLAAPLSLASPINRFLRVRRRPLPPPPTLPLPPLFQAPVTPLSLFFSPSLSREFQCSNRSWTREFRQLAWSSCQWSDSVSINWVACLWTAGICSSDRIVVGVANFLLHFILFFVLADELVTWINVAMLLFFFLFSFWPTMQ